MKDRVSGHCCCVRIITHIMLSCTFYIKLIKTIHLSYEDQFVLNELTNKPHIFAI